jgi:predicted nuclease with TOPRIM domain
VVIERMEKKIRELKDEVKGLHRFLKELVDDYSLPGKSFLMNSCREPAGEDPKDGRL